jgi:hypothetical protein
MAMSINGAIKKRGRPATGTGKSINVRLQPAQLAALDAWIAGQGGDSLTRPEAVRMLVEIALSDP